MTESVTLTVSLRETMGLYLRLKTHEMELDDQVIRFLRKLENELYQRLTIDELENLQKSYQDMKD